MNEKKRETERINRMLRLFQEIWETNSDMRFFQLMDMLQREYASKKNGYGKREGFELDSKGYKFPISFVDLFYLEDNVFEEFLQEYINEVENRK
ncbi:hypothetical protein B5V88_07105 [Heyndrickxia sporothermodurans]|uniref:DUF1040 family protein n=1 Tax=Heyndrickxia sporothermodurans TaxID=46224 RepID=A0AB37HHI1_9BACI|nr:DUF1040 family protein [Heyndrickxia sporothermodurans]MBL5767359.1 DUF1040 family protein [Heyndrickxia sporothermodurans]MBL5770832.1 DUF1040 family protein [Heyndrickxia sporothermodurans]MBL5774472.1 DUF1040 family protein [Heyndrickxia sporothermodurans]MBL5779564.1 DUF1040 family protein [Heyndrickxia sporothermodurans]MBL5781559.1 DUF1040 family protein [Heyndrickxia sporothermodurans]